MRKIKRYLRIIRNQLHNTSFIHLMVLLSKNFVKKDKILIYGIDLDKYEKLDVGDAHVEKGSIAELKELRKDEKYNRWEFFCDHFDGVKDFFVFKSDNQVAHISWIYRKKQPNRIIELKDNEAEIKYCLTLREFRGNSIYPIVLKSIQAYLQTSKYTKAFICVRDDNIPSIRGIEKAGFNLRNRLRLVKVLGVQLNRKYSSPS